MVNAPPPAPLGEGAAVPATILVVDDEKNIRRTLEMVLRGEGYEVTEAGSAEEALEILARGERPVDLAVIDLLLPGMSGLDLLPKAKAARPDVPVIMITAYGDAETKRKALENGADALFTKPIDFVTLRSEIETRVERAA